MTRRRDKFMEDMGRIQQARQRRRAEREEEFLHGDEPPWVRRWANPLEDLSFTPQEVGCLGKEVSRGLPSRPATWDWKS